MSINSVVLIGDSIRMGYAPAVTNALSGTADVWAPDDNCGPSSRIVESLQDWIASRKPDLFHINCGLHDIKIDKETKAYMVPRDAYMQNLAAILDAALATGARVVFALTTPVDESHNARKGFDRFNRDIDDYNTVARDLCARRNSPVNDLNAFVRNTPALMQELIDKDGVHYTETGSATIGAHVAEIIHKHL